MPQSTDKATSRKAGPILPRELARAGRVARRLHSELTSVVEDLPAPARAATGMARHLDLVRNTCQRVVAAVSDAEPGPRLLGRLPGVQGLRQFIEAIIRTGVDEERVRGLSVAVDEFETVIHELAGSQARLIQRLAATEEPKSDEEVALASLDARQDLFRAAGDCVGRSLDVHLSILAFRRDPTDARRIEGFAVTGMIGFRSHRDGMPIVLEYADSTTGIAAENRNRVKLLDEAPPAGGSTPRAVLEAFSSSPLPVVVSRDENGDVYQSIEPAKGDGAEAADVVLAYRSTFIDSTESPEDPPLENVWTLINTPARHLLMDVYLDRDLAGACVPSIDAQLWMQDLKVRMPWATRLPHVPRLEFLGFGGGSAGRAGAAPDAEPPYARHEELTAFMFDRVGWALGDFVGYRCAMPYPIWRAGYRMTFRSLVTSS